MGRSMEFYSGDAAMIGTRFTDYDWGSLRELRDATSHVDFSLHFALSDLDLLTQELSDTLGANVPDFTQSLGRVVGGDGSEFSARPLSRTCVELLGIMDDGIPAPDVADAWTSLMAEARGTPQLSATPDLIQGLSHLGRLCRAALATGQDVVFCSYP